MTQMIVNPPYIYLDPLGNPLEGSMFVGKPNLDPSQPANQLLCRDGINGAILDQPIIIQGGRPKNNNGQFALVVIPSQEYAVQFLDGNGRVIDSLSESKVIGDALSVDGGGSGGTADRVFNNLVQATDENLDGVNYIFIKSDASGWEGTATGPTINEYFYSDGTVGQASTIESPSKFYDAQGNGFTKASALYDNTASGLTAENYQGAVDELKSLTDSAQTDATQAIDDAAAAQSTADANSLLLNILNPGAPTGETIIDEKFTVGQPSEVSGTYSVPADSYLLRVTLIGAGGNGGDGVGVSSAKLGGGGGGGGAFISFFIDVSGGESLDYLIATGGVFNQTTRLSLYPNIKAGSGNTGVRGTVDQSDDFPYGQGGYGGKAYFDSSYGLRLIQSSSGSLGQTAGFFGENRGGSENLWSSGGRGGQPNYPILPGLPDGNANRMGIGGSGGAVSTFSSYASGDNGSGGGIIFEYWTTD